ncbi:MAG TPA: hypothetical protein VF103_08260 [Polyangiaceae bacterium]
MKRVTGRCLSLVLFGVVAGCSVGNQLVAGRGEYELYRDTHLAMTLEARLAAGNRYLKSDPEGRYAPEIKAWFEPAEQSYVGAAWNSLPRLRAYLQAMPDGPSSERVKARAEELEATIGFAAKHEKQEKARIEEIQVNLERAAEQRKAFLDDISGWIRTLSAVRSWNKPLAELDPQVLARFGGDRASDSCVDELCSKAFTPRFAIPVKEKIVPREAAYSVELVVKGGAVIEARVRGRELFSRLGEALDKRAVSFSDPQSRAEGIGRALGLVTNALDGSFAAEGCEHPAVSPIVLERACGGVRVVATAALTTGDDDVIGFGPATPPPEPPKAPAKGAGKAPPAKPKAPNAPKPPAAPAPAP